MQQLLPCCCPVSPMCAAPHPHPRPPQSADQTSPMCHITCRPSDVLRSSACLAASAGVAVAPPHNPSGPVHIGPSTSVGFACAPARLPCPHASCQQPSREPDQPDQPPNLPTGSRSSLAVDLLARASTAGLLAARCSRSRGCWRVRTARTARISDAGSGITSPISDLVPHTRCSLHSTVLAAQRHMRSLRSLAREGVTSYVAFFFISCYYYRILQ